LSAAPAATGGNTRPKQLGELCGVLQTVRRKTGDVLFEAGCRPPSKQEFISNCRRNTMLKRWAYASVLLAVLAVAGARGETFTFDSSADTWTGRNDTSQHGGDEYIYVRGGTMDRMGYVRFDLSALRIKSIESVALVFTVHGSLPKPLCRNDTVVVGRIAVYGLNDVAGNTPQNWNEATLTSMGIGYEMNLMTDSIVTDHGRTTDLDGDVNGVTETVVTAAGGGSALGTKVVIEGDALAGFIKTRAAGGGLVTFILKDDDSAERGFGFCSREYADAACRPMLEISGQITAKPKVAYVTTPCDNNEDGVQDDAGWVDWLKTEGCRVDVRKHFWSQSLGESDITELEASDLIIVSRALNIADLTGTETAKWNALTRPMICLNALMVGSNRWKWIHSMDVRANAGAPAMLVTEPNHPFFAGVALDAGGCVQVLDPNVASGHTSFFKDVNDAGNGTILSMCRGTYNSAWIVEWPAGVEYYTGAGMVAGGRRVLFMAGTQDSPYTDANDLPMPIGVFNLTAAGKQILRNVIESLLPKQDL
jgi:hypothetical protein